MHTKRIIPCLDVNNGRVVKGVNFVSLRDAGDPVEIAKAYDKAGADELVFLDITASSDARGTVVDMVRKVAENVFIPFTVGGGIRTVDDFKALLREGADKISINSSAINTPNLISEAAEKFGSQCVVVAIDAKKREDGSGWNIYKNGGRIDVGIDAVEWASKVEKLGAGEILLTSMDCDGTKAGYDLELTKAIAGEVNILYRIIPLHSFFVISDQHSADRVAYYVPYRSDCQTCCNHTSKYATYNYAQGNHSKNTR